MENPDPPAPPPTESEPVPNLYPPDMEYIAPMPVQQAALALQSCIPDALRLTPLDDMVFELQCLMRDADAGDLDDLLANQARMLDSVFTRTVADAVKPKSYNEGRMQLALTAQRQCHASIKALRQLQHARVRDNMNAIKKSAKELMRNR